ncbi:MAG: hypothetical protein E7365_05825 [Clostridiales bacterium]|nr:hypothetical protein [Clostridiales bacterium]
MKLFESSKQAPLFALFIILGIILGIVYDIFYVFRYKRRPVLMAVSDILFSGIFFVLTLHFIEKFNNGNMYWFIFLALILGFIAERITLGNFIKIFIDFFAKILYNLYRRLNISKYLKMLSK